MSDLIKCYAKLIARMFSEIRMCYFDFTSTCDISTLKNKIICHTIVEINTKCVDT